MPSPVSIPINADGSTPLVCAPGGNDGPGGAWVPGQAKIALCGCLCCATGNECLHDFLPFGGLTADGRGVDGGPNAYFEPPGRPEGYQLLGRRFDLIESSVTTTEHIESSATVRETRRTVTTHPHRVRFRIAPFGMSDADFLSEYGGADDAPDDPGGGTGWVKASEVSSLPPVINHATGAAVLELWVNPDRITRTTAEYRMVDGELLEDSSVDGTSDNPFPTARIVHQSNALGQVNPSSRCDGLYYARPLPAAFVAISDGWFFAGNLASFGGSIFPDIPQHLRVAEFDEDETFTWRYAHPEATLAGWKFVAEGGSFSGGLTKYGAADTGFTVPLTEEWPGQVTISASVSYGDASSSSFDATYHAAFGGGPDGGPHPSYSQTGSRSSAWTSELVVVEECPEQMGLPELDCPDPQDLPMAAVACDYTNAPLDIVAYDPAEKPAWGNTLQVTFPLGAMPGDEGAETFSYWATTAPTLSDVVTGVWSMDQCPRPVVAIACDGVMSDGQSVDSIVIDANTIAGVSCLDGSRRYFPTTTPAPGGFIVEVVWTDEPCPPVDDGALYERCSSGSFDYPVEATPPLRVRMSNFGPDVDIGFASITWGFGYTTPGAGGLRSCTSYFEVHYRKITDDGGSYRQYIGTPEEGPCGSLADRFLGRTVCSGTGVEPGDPSEPGDLAIADDGRRRNPYPSHNPMADHEKYWGCVGCGG